MSAAIRRQVSQIFSCDFSVYEPELAALQKIREYDEYTYLHCLNVTRLSVHLGQRLGLEQQELVDLGWAALLHDLGKLHVPLQILNKVKKFHPEELVVMQSHPLESVAVFADLQSVTLESLRRLSAAFEHHQRYDLKGYPRVKNKMSLHPFSRIVAITDTFDAMTTDRIYQRRVLPDVALRVMSSGFGTIFDPFVLQAFITTMGAFPVGSLVRLSTDELALVKSYNETAKLDRPVVYRFQKPFPDDLNLMDPLNHSIKILRCEFPEENGVHLEDLQWK